MIGFMVVKILWSLLYLLDCWPFHVADTVVGGEEVFSDAIREEKICASESTIATAHIN